MINFGYSLVSGMWLGYSFCCLLMTKLPMSFQTVGAGIARPSPTDDTVQSQRIVPADMGRAMPAPTV
ncbi:MAG: hypothetical protein FWD97_05510 [Defluviitaleaceae bacterium]|nr:hypothetical protein [Defluviitaleaceae bacterium]